MDDFKYLVYFGGGIGEDVWDGELDLEAYDIFQGLSKAKEILDNKFGESVYQIFSIEQND